jgi:AraC-like DNA-binding protein
MIDLLLDHVGRYAVSLGSQTGIVSTPVRGLAISREVAPTMLEYSVSKPQVTLVLQGDKRITVNGNTFEIGAGDHLVIAADMPTVGRVTIASPAQPYYSVLLELDLTVITDLVRAVGPSPPGQDRPIRVETIDAEVAGAALRLLRLLDRPAALAVLGSQLSRELHYWLLVGRHGGAIGTMGIADSHARRIASSVAMLRAHYDQSLKVEALARAANMRPSAFHAHFHSITSVSPLQFQKQLRLVEARRRMLAHGEAISEAARGVGYGSVPQFTREYSRIFGQSPARDVRQARAQVGTDV